MTKLYFLSIFTLLTSNAFACICWFGTDKKSVKEKIEKADVIVYASIVPESMNSLFADDSSLYVTDVIFSIEKVWKGSNLSTVKFDAKMYPCGDAEYRIGERYIIFGYLNSETGKLETNNCNSLAEGIWPYPYDIRLENPEFDEVREFITKRTR